jgi:hypothetical protein
MPGAGHIFTTVVNKISIESCSVQGLGRVQPRKPAKETIARAIL